MKLALGLSLLLTALSAASLAAPPVSSHTFSSHTLKCDALAGTESLLVDGTTEQKGQDLTVGSYGAIDSIKHLSTQFGKMTLITQGSENEGTDLTLVLTAPIMEEGSSSCAIMFYKGYDLLNTPAGVAPNYSIKSVQSSKVSADTVDLHIALQLESGKVVSRLLRVQILAKPAPTRYKVSVI